MSVLMTMITVVQILSAVVLITLVMSQTTKSEGLTGTIGGKMSASFRGKPGLEDRLGSLTKLSAIAFMVATALMYYVHVKTGV